MACFEYRSVENRRSHMWLNKQLYHVQILNENLKISVAIGHDDSLKMAEANIAKSDNSLFLWILKWVKMTDDRWEHVS